MAIEHGEVWFPRRVRGMFGMVVGLGEGDVMSMLAEILEMGVWSSL